MTNAHSPSKSRSRIRARASTCFHSEAAGLWARWPGWPSCPITMNRTIGYSHFSSWTSCSAMLRRRVIAIPCLALTSVWALVKARIRFWFIAIYSCITPTWTAACHWLTVSAWRCKCACEWECPWSVVPCWHGDQELQALQPPSTGSVRTGHLVTSWCQWLARWFCFGAGAHFIRCSFQPQYGSWALRQAWRLRCLWHWAAGIL